MVTLGFRHGSVFGTSYFGASTGTVSLVPDVLPFALDGHAYMIDWKAQDPLVRTAVETLREQFDASDEPGEVSLNREGLWRRSRSSWHVGEGQEFCDTQDFNSARYHQGQGVNPWIRDQLELLHEVELKTASANTNLYLAMAGSHLYWTDGTALRYFTDIVAGLATNVTGGPATAATSIVSNGFHVWTAHASNGVYRTTRGAATTTSHITGTVSLLGYVRNRVMAANGASLYDVTSIAHGAAAALPAALYTHPNADFVWTSFAEGSANIYMGGYSGTKSLIYRTAVVSDGTVLGQPVVAAELPIGETVTSLYGYLGKFIVIGTNLGWRFAVVTESGDLSVGARVDTPLPVTSFFGVGEFIWYSWGGFSDADTGIGRLSTAEFSDTDNLIPAYASDLMVTGSANIQGIAFANDRVVFTVSGQGLYFEGEDCVESGYFDTGKITFNMTETKIGMYVDCQHLMHHGTFEVLVSVDEEDFVSIGVRDADIHPLPSLAMGQVEAQTFELRFVLNRDAMEAHMCPRLLAWTLRAQPRPEVTDMIYVAILLAPSVTSLTDTIITYDTDAELAFIQDCHRTKRIVPAQFGRTAVSAILENYRADYVNLNYYPDGPPGHASTVTLKLKEV